MTIELSGNLAAFGLADVLTLLGMGQRTARVDVSAAGRAGQVRLIAGCVSDATSDCTRAGLLRRVITSVPVSDRDLAAAIQTPHPVACLVQSGAVPRETAQAIAVEHIVDAASDVLTWAQGEFAVSIDEPDGTDVGLRLPVPELVDRSRARAAEWERLRRALPERTAVLALASTLADGTSVDGRDWSVLSRIDGRRTVGEVVATAACGSLAASDRLVGLLGRGLVEVCATEPAAGPDAVAAMLAEFERRLVDPVHGIPSVGVAEMLMVAPELEPELQPELQPEPEPVPEPLHDDAADPMPGTDHGLPDAFLVGSDWFTPVEGPTLTCAPVDALTQPPSLAATPPEAALPEPSPVATPPEAPSLEPPPVEAPIAPAMSWSPWAQALGLAAPAPAGELIVDPLAGRGIAQLIKDAAGTEDIEQLPVPLMPIAEGPWGEEPSDDGIVDAVGGGQMADAQGDSATAEDPMVPEPSGVAESDGFNPLSGALLSELIASSRRP